MADEDPTKEELELIKLRLEIEKLRLDVADYRDCKPLSDQKLAIEINELQRAPKRSMTISVLTLAASMFTSFIVAFLAFSVNWSANVQHEAEDFQKLVAQLASANGPARLGAAMGMRPYVRHPQSWIPYFNRQDRAEPSFSMLAYRMLTERDPLVLGAIRATLKESDVDSATAFSEVEGVDLELKRRLYLATRAALRSLLVKKTTLKTAPQELESIVRGTTQLLAVPDDVQSAAIAQIATYQNRLTIRNAVESDYTAGDARTKAEYTSSEGRARSALANEAVAAAAASIVVSDLMQRSHEFASNYLSNTLVSAANLDGQDFSNIDWSKINIGGTAKKANLACAHLNKSDVTQLDLAGASLAGADLADAELPDNDAIVHVGGELANSNWYESYTAKMKGHSLYDRWAKLTGPERARIKSAYVSAKNNCATASGQAASPLPADSGRSGAPQR